MALRDGENWSASVNVGFTLIFILRFLCWLRLVACRREFVTALER
jgi:hypothetical protein